MEIVNLSKKYAWHRAPPELEDDDPELNEEEEAPVHEIEPGGEHWALRGVNLAIQPGERVGIIGSNGAGKSTLLNILAGITLPSGGFVRGTGLCILLNSVRTPFRAQLTGRQNLHILAALLGVDVDRLESRLPEILAFSGMEEFIDRRVLHYSTQQYRRLSFATALMLDPDIILSDDTLGIGDARYQQRSEQLIAQKVEKDGVIFMFASNRLKAVQDLCSRVIWLEHGRVAADGPAEQVIEAFMDADKREDESIGELEGIEPEEELPPRLSLATKNEANTVSGVEPAAVSDVEPAAVSGVEPAAVSGVEPAAVSGVEPAAVSGVEPATDSDVGPGAVSDVEPAVVSDVEPAALPQDEDVPIATGPRPWLSQWRKLARRVAERRKTADRKRIERWTQAKRQWLSHEKSFGVVPGIGELLDLKLDYVIEAEKSALEVTVRLEQQGTEVSIFMDSVVGQVHVFSSELPAHFFAPASGAYRFTVSIDNVFFQARISNMPYAKAKLRIKVYVRPPDGDRWHLLSGIVRILLPGEEWEPRIAYTGNAAGPVLKPLLRWDVEAVPDEESDRVRSEARQPDQQIALKPEDFKQREFTREGFTQEDWPTRVRAMSSRE